MVTDMKSRQRVAAIKQIMGLINTKPGTEEKFVCVKLSLDNGVTKQYVADIINDMVYVEYLHRKDNLLYPGSDPDKTEPGTEQVEAQCQ